MILKKFLEKRAEKAKRYETEKRNFVRLVYPPDKRPVLTIGDNSFEVLNICRTGLKFLNHMEKRFSDQVFGQVAFQNGGTIKINGKIRWESGREIGLFATNIPAFVIKQEIRTFIRREADEETVVLDGASLEPAKEEFQIERE